MSRHVEMITDIQPYLKCREQLSLTMWSDFLDRVRNIRRPARPRTPKQRQPREDENGNLLDDQEGDEEDDEEEDDDVFRVSLGHLRREWAKYPRFQNDSWRMD